MRGGREGNVHDCVPGHAGSTRAVRGSITLLACALLILAGCAAPTPPPTALSTGPTVIVPFTPNPQDVPLPTLLPTVALAPTSPPVTKAPATPASVPTVTPIQVTVTAPAPTRAQASATSAESATPFPEGLPEVFVTALRVEPATPKADAGGRFFVTFQNLSGKDQGYNWAVEIWDVDNNKRPFGLTTPQNSPMPAGVTNLTSTGWTVKGLGECHAYRARVVARDDEDNRATFIQRDGSILWLDFTVCP